jgi:hypothetical protein
MTLGKFLKSSEPQFPHMQNKTSYNHSGYKVSERVK